MKATFKLPPNFGTHHFDLRDRAERHFTGSMIVVDPSLMRCDDLPRHNYEVLTARFYGTASISRCCVWAYRRKRNGVEISVRGSGNAGGSGYRRPLAALEEALRHAGFKLGEPIDGRGELAMREALLACARALGVRNPRLVEAWP